MQRPFPALPMHLTPCCGAKTRAASPCSSPALPNGRCRMPGGSSPGAPKGRAYGNYCHGRFTCEAIPQQREPGAWIRTMVEIVQEVG
jgi:hypothetical protein